MTLAATRIRAGNHALSRPAVPNRRTRAALQPDAPTAPSEPTGGLTMRWSSAPDGRLHCIWPPADSQPLAS
jgi:hypothetical protein